MSAGREYHPELQEGVSLRCAAWTGVLLVALLTAPAALRAQQQPPSPVDAVPEGEIRLFKDLREAFRSIFGPGGSDAPAPQQTPAGPAAQPQSPPPAAPSDAPNAQREPARPAATAPGSQPQAVAASPSAAAAPQSLHAAIAKGDYASALKMIEQGTDIEAKDPGAGASPLHYAVMKGDMPLVGLLVQRGANVNSRTKSGTSPLHTAVLYGRREVAEYLLDKGSDVNAKSASGATPLSLAQAANFERIAKMLRERGAN
jgi:hypothetical protein